jgi:OOP family OmpA-OmpF porin
MHKIGIILVIALGAPAVASAQERPAKTIELGGFVGVHLFDEDAEIGVADAADSQAPDDFAGVGVRMGWLFGGGRFAVEGELAVVPTASNGVDVTVFGWRASGLFHVTTGAWRPFVLLGGGALSMSSTDSRVAASDTDLVGHVGLGVKWDVADDWGLRLDGRALLPPSSESEGPTVDGEIWIGFYGRFPLWHEKKPEEKKAEPPPPAPAPKPAPPAPKPAPPAPPRPADADGDGVPDAEDAVPDAAEDKDGFQDEDGAPDPDNDGDAVLDAADGCPVEAETPNGYRDGDGCADEMPKEVQALVGPIAGVAFTPGKAALTKAAQKALDKVAAVLVAVPEVSVGITVLSPELAGERAEAVRQYLVQKGVDAARIEVTGAAPDKPDKPKEVRVELRVLVTPGQ